MSSNQKSFINRIKQQLQIKHLSIISAALILAGCGSTGGVKLTDEASSAQAATNILAVYDKYEKDIEAPTPGYELVKYIKANKFIIDKNGYAVSHPQVGHDIAAAIYKPITRYGDQGRIMVAFRGTANVIEALQDLQVRLVPFVNSNGETQKNVEVEKGFFNFYTSMRDEIMDYINDNNPTEIILGGHSLGAAAAILAGYDIATSTNHQVKIYNVGTPRVGNEGFIDAMNELVHDGKLLPALMQNRRDQVTKVPPKLFGYDSFSKDVIYPMCFYQEGEKYNVHTNHLIEHYQLALLYDFWKKPKPEELVICN